MPKRVTSRWIVIGGAASIFILYVLGYQFLKDTPAATVFSDAISVVANLLAIAGCLVAFRRGKGVTRVFWLLFACSFALQLAANAGWAWLHYAHISVHAPALFPSLFFRLYAGPMAIALFLSEDRNRTRFETFLDGSIVVGLVGLTMYQVQMAELNAHDVRIWRIITVSAAVNLVLLLAAVARIALSGPCNLCSLFRRQVIFLAAYSAVSLITSFGDAYLAEIDGYIDLVWILPYLIGAVLAFNWRPADQDILPVSPRISRRASLLCFNLILATMVLVSAVLGVRVVDSTRLVGLAAITVVLFSYAIRCSLMQDKQEKYLVALQDSRIQLQHQALYDELTGLPNRRLFGERLRQTLALATRERQTIALLYLDLDGFKAVNDNMGHAIGDLLLKEVAQRMLQRVREADTLARMGGDEFTVILTNLGARENARLVAEELRELLCEPFLIEKNTIHLSASVGIGIFPQSATDAEMLVQQADLAMYAVKHCCKNDVKFYSPRDRDSEAEPSIL